MKAQHLIFCRAYIKLPDHVKAYQTAYPGTPNKQASNQGLVLLKRPEIAQFIADEQKIWNDLYEQARKDAIEKLAAEEVASQHEIKATLTKIIRKRGVKTTESGKASFPTFENQIQAAKTLNDMCGYNAKKETDINVKGSVEAITGMVVEK